MKRWLLLGVCLAVILFPLFGFAQQAERPVVTVTKLAEGKAPIIDGTVDDEAWDGARAYSTFTQQEPNDGQPATERTEVRFLMNRTTLYVGIIAFDSEPSRIIVSQSRRDAELTDTDSVQILLDTFNDGQNGFVFGTNPFGIEYDGQVMGEGQGGLAGFGRGGAGGGAAAVVVVSALEGAAARQTGST